MESASNSVVLVLAGRRTEGSKERRLIAPSNFLLKDGFDLVLL